MLYLLAYVLLPLLVGCLLLVGGYFMLRRREIAPGTRPQLVLQQQLASWEIDDCAPWGIDDCAPWGIDDCASPQILQDVNKCMRTLAAFTFMGMGSGLLLAALIMACVALLTTGTLLAGSSTRGEPFAELMLLLLFVGSWFGERAGFRRLRREATAHIAFGDLRRRLVADYRSPLVHVIPVLLGIVNIVVALISISSVPSSIRIVLMNNTAVWWPSWVLLILPVLILLLPPLVEASLGSIVRFPRLLVTTSPALAQRIDNMLRAIIIGSLLGSEYSIVGNLQIGQFLLFGKANLSGSSSTQLSGSIQAWLLISFLLGMILIIVGTGAGMLKGHVGGKISGWPWQSTKEALDGTATTDR